MFACLASVPWTTFQGHDIYIRVQHLSGRDKGKQDGWIIISSCAHWGRQTPAAVTNLIKGSFPTPRLHNWQG